MAVDVAKVLKDAWQAVKDSGVPKGLQEIAFNRAVEFYGYAPAGQSPIVPPPSTSGRGAGSSGGTRVNSTTTGNKSESDFYDAMSAATGIDRGALEKLIDVHDGAPRIALKASQLPSAASKAQQVVSLLIILARHYYNDESQIQLSLCLAECKRLSCLNANFKRDVGRIPDLMLVGTGNDTTAKVREPLVKSCAATLKKLGVTVD